VARTAYNCGRATCISGKSKPHRINADFLELYKRNVLSFLLRPKQQNYVPIIFALTLYSPKMPPHYIIQVEPEARPGPGGRETGGHRSALVAENHRKTSDAEDASLAQSLFAAPGGLPRSFFRNLHLPAGHGAKIFRGDRGYSFRTSGVSWRRHPWNRRDPLRDYRQEIAVVTAAAISPTANSLERNTRSRMQARS